MYNRRRLLQNILWKLLCLLCFFPLTLPAQDLMQMVTDLQNKYKESEAAILNTRLNFDFKLKDEKVTITEERNEKLLALRYNCVINQMEFYDNNSRIEEFSCSSNLNQEAPDREKVCGNYTNHEYFFDDNKCCSHKLKLKQAGEIWDMHVSKVFNDSRYLTSIYFHDKYPVIKKTVTLHIPAEIEVDIKEFNFEKFEVSKKESLSGNQRTVEYTLKNLSAMENVRLSRSVQFNYPHLLILVKSYQSEGKRVNILSNLNDLYGWYRSLTKELSPKTEVFKETVDQLISGKVTDEERIGSIFYWVQDNIRYIAFEDGLAGFKPDEAHLVFSKKYGDCKGMANLTKEMLRYAGYDARLSWIGTKRIRYDYTLPSLAVDNHMICTVLLKEKKYFLDATEKYMPIGTNADRIQGRQILIENGDGYLLDQIPELSKESEIELRELRLTMKDETLNGRYRFILNGEKKRNFLCIYHYASGGDTRDKLVRHCLAEENKNIKVSNIYISDLHQRDGNFEITSDLESTGFISSFNNERYIDIDFSEDYKNWIIDESRQSDIDFGEKIMKVLDIELEIPEGDSVIFLPDSIQIDHHEFSIHAGYALKKNKIVYKKYISIDKGIITRESFALWNSAIRKLTHHYDSQIILKH